MYIPSSLLEERVYGYDVNSLYPYVMRSNDMPVGRPKYFTCLRSFDFINYYISVFNKKPFGFLSVEVTAPEDIAHPILQTKVNTLYRLSFSLRLRALQALPLPLVPSTTRDGRLGLGRGLILFNYASNKDLCLAHQLCWGRHPKANVRFCIL